MLLNSISGGLTGLATALLAKKLGLGTGWSIGLGLATGAGAYALTDVVRDYIKKPSQPQAADEYTAKLLLDSVYYAQLGYSTANGGDGKRLFTSNQGSLRDWLPPVVFDTFNIEGWRPAKHNHGYVIKPIKLADDSFEYHAVPAEGFTGKSFKVDQTGTVTETENN